MNNRLVPERSRDLIYIMDILIGAWLETLSNMHIEMPKETQDLIQKQTNVTYIGLHKSPWETMAIPHAIKSKGGQAPYIVMKDDAIENKIVMYLLEKAGAFTVDREGPKKETAFGLLDKIADVLGHHDSLLIFPEGKITWTGEPEKFKTTIFQGVVQAAKNEPQHVVSVNIDYSRLIDSFDHSFPVNAIPRRPIKNRARWLGHIGDVYISFGKPVRVEQGYDRKTLTEKMWKDSTDLIKIQPVNVFSTVVSNYLVNNPNITSDKEIDNAQIYEGISKLMNELEPHKNKFRNLRMTDDPVHIAQNSLLPLTLEKKYLYALYAGYIKPYINEK